MDVDLPVANRLPDVLDVKLVGEMAMVDLEAALDLGPLLGREEFCTAKCQSTYSVARSNTSLRFWVVVDDPIRRKRHQDARKTFKNKNPRPGRQSTNTIHLGNASGQDAAKGASKRGGGEKQRHPEPALVSAVPLRDVVVDAWEETALKQAKEDACGEQAGVVLDKALADHTGGPADHDEGQPDGWPDALHHGVAGDLGRDVEWEEDGEAVVVLQTVQAQVLFEVVEAGVADVCAIEEAEAGGRAVNRESLITNPFNRRVTHR